ncbi:Clp protease N-terminal domain-containing protein [Couchioplanes azureus]|uniref:Clp protease N-terminal domain-containing protein n=1 Tax=Couchioplanes caeruleus TaxID=56438 RepID=UPI00166F67A8|nr:Clp protease N-terminal domain-containing protein [Couchioplanes caeruleus]GGQ54290.1 Clp protease [Couchioplanes caeruleus subsp. azureus]
MFERFTRAAREAVVRAQAAARELGQAPVGTEHVLLALLAEPAGPIASAPALRDRQVDAGYARAEIVRRAGRDTGTTATDTDAADREALRAIGIDLDAVRRAIEENFGPGALHLPRDPAPRRKGLFRRGNGHIPFSRRAKKVLELSLREAIRLKHNFIAPEHIMLGILREGQGRGSQILADRGVDVDGLRADLTRSLHADAA